MIVLSRHDIDRLSPACRDEIQQLFFSRQSEAFSTDVDVFGFEMSSDFHSFDTNTDTHDDVEHDTRRVVEINPDQAKKLVANISEKSLQTLQLFTSGLPVRVDALVGIDKPYENLTDLKRSFVGAVTRRLRTVTRNKKVSLFLRDSVTGNDGDEKVAISVRPATAESLLGVLGTLKSLTKTE